EVPNTDLNKGDLILVNFDNPYSLTDEVATVNVRENRVGNIVVSALAVAVRQDMLQALIDAVADMTEQGFTDSLLVNSGYRNVADQQEVWNSYLDRFGEEYTRDYVAVPGCSEHHTGLAADLGFYTQDGATIPVADHQFGTWLTSHCTDYGLILRYPENKKEITHTANEPWHFRYIGKVHAMIYRNFDMCYEEYVEYLKQYTADTKLLHVTPSGAVSETAADSLPETFEGYYVFYVPRSEGDTTALRVPFPQENVSCEISGNNRDGFIVTVSCVK
ncbi:MAG: M15 family metallopeptidase, partial [Clostridia bacterium]|nr:M15 family metallopeptidase [Clostridia bacterium]